MVIGVQSLIAATHDGHSSRSVSQYRDQTLSVLSIVEVWTGGDGVRVVGSSCSVSIWREHLCPEQVANIAADGCIAADEIASASCVSPASCFT